MNFASYDPKGWNVELGGLTITAIGEDGVAWEKAEANGEAKWGCQGDAIWQVSNNGGYYLTVNVMANCPQKKQIIALFKKGEPFAASASHKGLNERFGGTMALFEEEPAFERGTEAGDIELKVLVFDGKTEYI